MAEDLEVKGQDSEQNRAKRAAMEAWVKAVNQQGGFGVWVWVWVWVADVAFDPAKLRDIIMLHSTSLAEAVPVL
jgi:type III restriction enzyme